MEKFLDLDSMPQINFEESLYIPLTTFPSWTSFIENHHLLKTDHWAWDGGGRETEKGGDVCIVTAASHCCSAKTNTTL